jgi:hypothetical protein
MTMELPFPSRPKYLAAPVEWVAEDNAAGEALETMDPIVPLRTLPTDVKHVHPMMVRGRDHTPL